MKAVIEKIRRLRRLATSDNVNEANAAAAAAARLVEEHRISEAELEPTNEDVIEKGVPLFTCKRVEAWRQNLVVILAHNNNVRVYESRANAVTVEKTVMLFGRAADIEIVKYFYAWLSVEFPRVCAVSAVRGPLGIPRPIRGSNERRSFLIGATIGLDQQLKAARSSVRVQAAIAGQSTALVRVDQQAEAVSKAFEETFRDIKPKNDKVKAIADATAFRLGVHTGANIHLGKSLPAPGWRP